MAVLGPIARYIDVVCVLSEQGQSIGLLEAHLCFRTVELVNFREYVLVVENPIASTSSVVQLNESNYHNNHVTVT